MKKALALFDDDNAILDGELEFTVKDLRDHLSEIELEEPDPDAVIRQEFSLVLEQYVSDIASFKLKLENEDMTFFL